MAIQYKVTIHGAPGPEPFTVVSVSEHTTAKQLLDMVSLSIHTGHVNGT